LAAPRQFAEDTQGLCRSACARVCPHQHAEHRRVAPRKGGAPFEDARSFRRLAVLNQRKAEVPQGSRFVWLHGEYGMELANGFRMAAREEQYPADVPAVQREWVQLAGTLRPLERFVRPALREQPPSPPVVRGGIVRIEIEGAAVTCVCLDPLP